MDIAILPKPKRNVKISQSNELTQAAYYLSLQAKRVLWLCLMQTYHEDEHDGVFHLKVADYQKYFICESGYRQYRCKERR